MSATMRTARSPGNLAHKHPGMSFCIITTAIYFSTVASLRGGDMPAIIAAKARSLRWRKTARRASRRRQSTVVRYSINNAHQRKTPPYARNKQTRAVGKRPDASAHGRAIQGTAAKHHPTYRPSICADHGVPMDRRYCGGAADLAADVGGDAKPDPPAFVGGDFPRRSRHEPARIARVD